MIYTTEVQLQPNWGIGKKAAKATKIAGQSENFDQR